ncbi:MAG: acyl-CoA thioesterase [Actinomycetaceae bacterium]|nr:acyl-CoA thioesterase [Actinomycetaceae bacterium]
MSTRSDSVTLRFLAAPMDVNTHGYVDGGKILEWIDKAGYACAAGWSGRYAVTGYVGNIRFSSGIAAGNMVEVEARMVYTGRTSMQVVCTVSSYNPQKPERIVNTQCLLVFVAMDSEGRPTPVPEFVPYDDWSRIEHERALTLTGVRKEIEKAMVDQVYTDATEACRETLRFLAAPTDVNWGGKVHGGYVMHWIMKAGQLVAERWSHGRAEAVYAGGFRFYRPILIGDLIEVDARMIYSSGSEMHVSVWVRSGDPRGRDLLTATHCIIVFSARNDDGDDVVVRPWIPRLPEDRALERHAVDLIEIRKKLLRTKPHQAETAPETDNG